MVDTMDSIPQEDVVLLQLFDDKSALKDEISKRKVHDYVRDRQRVRDEVDHAREANVNTKLMRQAQDELRRMQECEAMEDTRRQKLEAEQAAADDSARLWASQEQRALWEKQEMEKKKAEGHEQLKSELRATLNMSQTVDKERMTDAQTAARLQKQCEFDRQYEDRVSRRREADKVKREKLREGADARMGPALSDIVGALDKSVERDRIEYEHRLEEERRQRVEEEQEMRERMYVRTLEKNRAYEKEKQRYLEACKRKEQKMITERKEVERELAAAAHDEELQARFLAWRRRFDEEQEELKLFRENDQVLRALEDLEASGGPVDAIDDGAHEAHESHE